MPDSARRCAMAAALAAIVSGFAISQATGAPTARTAAGNTMTATGVLSAVSDGVSSPYATVSGRIRAQGHKYGPRHCLADRVIRASAPTLDGGVQILAESDSNTDRKGRFHFSGLELAYGGVDWRTGDDISGGVVPFTGGTVTISLNTFGNDNAPKHRGDINLTYHCRPVSGSVQVQVPPPPAHY